MVLYAIHVLDHFDDLLLGKNCVIAGLLLNAAFLYIRFLLYQVLSQRGRFFCANLLSVRRGKCFITSRATSSLEV